MFSIIGRYPYPLPGTVLMEAVRLVADWFRSETSLKKKMQKLKELHKEGLMTKQQYERALDVLITSYAKKM